MGTYKTLRVHFFLLLSLIFSTAAKAQFNNSWIDYSKTYYKFKIGQDGLYRISGSVLRQAGLSGVPVTQFQLWRNGQEVPLFTSISAGVLTDSDFIEFYGQANDGSPDAVLYNNPGFQLSDKWSLFTDTAAYFLTISPNTTNVRIASADNNVSTNTLPPDPYFMHTLEKHFKDQINPGFAAVVGVYIYSSSFDNGEGWSSRNIQPASPLADQYNSLFLAPGGPDPIFRIAAFGNAPNARTLRVSVNGSPVLERRMDFFNSAIQEVSFSGSLLGRPVDTIRIADISAVNTDRITVGKYELVYPRQFNFGGSSQFSFSLPASTTGNYLEISGFNAENQAPVLYNLSENKRYLGDLTPSGLVRFALPAGGNRNFVLLNTVSQLRQLNNLQQRNFVNFSNSALQGNFLLITHPSLRTSGNGDPVMLYKSYRESTTGGSYKVGIYHVDELEDQFAFGIKKHPLSVKNFIAFARQRFQDQPQQVFLVGKGVTYDQYRINEARQVSELINLVPTFGNPGSDNILVSDDNDPTPEIPVGRLSVTNGDEIMAYLNKLKQYDQNLSSTTQTIAEKSWMKKVVHVIGGGDPYLQGVINGYMNTAKGIIEDTIFGGRVRTFEKLTPSGVEQVNSGLLEKSINEGLGLITYFGHSSANSMEFNLDDPIIFNNSGKYPLFLANGCNAGNFFIYDSLRLSVGRRSITENYVLTPGKGSIGFLASTHYGIVNYLNLYTFSLYNRIAAKDYGTTIGTLQQNALKDVMVKGGGTDFYNVITMEQCLLNGDPAVRLYATELPDFVVEDASVEVTPTPVSMTDSKFEVRVRISNIGRAVIDSVQVKVIHELPDGSASSLFDGKIARLFFEDSLSISVPMDAARYKGQNKIKIQVDPDVTIREITTSNNTVMRSFIISEDDIRPVYPYPFAITGSSSLVLKASVGKFTTEPRSFQVEADTTMLFNSPLRVEQTLSSNGGLIEFTPALQLKEGVVYYWRVAQKPENGAAYNWTTSSFVYQPNVGKGWSQSHYFQHAQNFSTDLRYNMDRQLDFGIQPHSYRINTAIQPISPNSVFNDQASLVPLLCPQVYGSFQVVMIDTKLGRPIRNLYQNNTGKFKSDFNQLCSPLLPNTFWYSYNNAISRKNMMDMFDSIPSGTMLVLMNLANATSRFDNISAWQSDTLQYGKDKSLYHKLKFLGFHLVDSLTRKLPFLFVARKIDDNNWEVIEQQVGVQINSILKYSGQYNSLGTAGKEETGLIGPSKGWKQIRWKGASSEPLSQDEITHQVIGIRKDFSEQLLFESQYLQTDTLISFIDAKTFPYLRVIRNFRDTLSNTPWQPEYLQVIYDEVPEGVLFSQDLQGWKDSLEVGAPVSLNVTFKNISETAFDSVKVNIGVIDGANQTRILSDALKKPIKPGDTLQMNYVLNTEKLKGANAVLVNFNPENAQPEQFMFNNYLIKGFYVGSDNVAPDLDVTFDGIHIMNRDVVSSKPEILMTLKDNSKFLALNDTSLFTIRLKSPDGVLRRLRFDGDTLQFIPPSVTGLENGNQAKVFYRPSLLQDGLYELTVNAKDRSNNLSGALDYNVAFEVINKSMITNLLNYPNPFTTSTAFVFTLTGSVAPTHLRIQIMTVTGKVVREITSQELGPIQIGQNVTSYKWDGRDQFGQELANGVYLYRVIAEINGKAIEKFNREDVNTDKYFKSGYGKMYLMR